MTEGWPENEMRWKLAKGSMQGLAFAAGALVGPASGPCAQSTPTSGSDAPLIFLPCLSRHFLPLPLRGNRRSRSRSPANGDDDHDDHDNKSASTSHDRQGTADPSVFPAPSRVQMLTAGNRQNGVGAFVLQCKKMDFHYCDWAGSSKGMKYVDGPSHPRTARHTAHPHTPIHETAS